jgi:hypothetical protein
MNFQRTAYCVLTVVSVQGATLTSSLMCLCLAMAPMKTVVTP